MVNKYSQGLHDKLTEAVCHSLKTLDEVLKEVDTGNPKVCNGLVFYKNSLKHSSSSSVRNSEQQTLAILDRVLAQYEGFEEVQTKEVEHDGLPTQNITNDRENIAIDHVDEKVTDSNKSLIGNPQGDKCGSLSSGPPVPKRNPSTCLSTISVNGVAPSTLPQDLEVSTDSGVTLPTESSTYFKAMEEKVGEHLESIGQQEKGLGKEQKAGELVKENRRPGRKLLSRKPIQKGAPRPKVKVAALQEDEELISTKEVIVEKNQQAGKNVSETGNSLLKKAIPEVILPKDPRFALIRQLLLSGKLPGLDELPPKFKPPPPPVITYNNSNVKKRVIKNSNTCDQNGNCTLSSAAVHVTSLQISGVSCTPPLDVPNVSVITIHNDNKCVKSDDKSLSEIYPENAHSTSTNNILNYNGNTKTILCPKIPTHKANSLISKNNCDSTNNSLELKTLPSLQQCQQTNNTNKHNNHIKSEPTLVLSTFSREAVSPKSSSQEDLCAPNNLERKPLDKPDVKSTGGSVFFNVFQCDNGTSESSAQGPVKKISEEEVGKKRGWIMRKSKKSKNAVKEEKSKPKELTASKNSDKSLVISELSGDLCNTSTIPKVKLLEETVNFLPFSRAMTSCIEDSDDSTSCTCDCVLKLPG